MKSSLFFLMLAVGTGVGIGIGFGTIDASRMTSEDLSIQNVPTRIAESLGERPNNSELDPEQVAQTLESLMQILNEEIVEHLSSQKRINKVADTVLPSIFMSIIGSAPPLHCLLRSDCHRCRDKQA